MERRRFTREFKLEAVRLIRDRNLLYAQASEDLKVHPTQLRNWVKAFDADRAECVPAKGQMKSEQLEIALFQREVINPQVSYSSCATPTSRGYRREIRRSIEKHRGI